MIQIYIELQNKKISPVVFELIGKAKELCAFLGLNDKAIITGFCAFDLSPEQREELGQYGIKKVYYINSQSSDFFYDFAVEGFAKALDISTKEDNTNIVLISGSEQGHILASSLGVIKNTGVTAECTELYLNEQDKLVQVRPAFSGNLMAEIITPYTDLQIATVHKNVFAKAEQEKYKPIEFIEINLDFSSKIEIVASQNKSSLTKKSEFQDITKSERLVVVGNGISQEDLENIQKFTHLIGASLAGTKLAVQNGLIPRECQIGLSGHTVSPKLAILFGVSGSLQFLAGMANAKKIIAINNDKDADIMKIAHYPIHGDVNKIIRALLEKISQE